MTVPWGAIVGGATSLAGGVLTNMGNKKAAQKQMDFQERMSNTSYQRAVADMKLAGINPMLAYMQGGASSPGGASPQIQDALSPAVSSAQHGARLGAELKQAGLQRDMMKKQMDGQDQINAGLFIDNHTKGLEQDAIAASTAESVARAAESRARLGIHTTEAELKKLGLAGAQNVSWVERLPFIGKGLTLIDRLRQSIGAQGPMVGPQRSSARSVQQEDSQTMYGRGFSRTRTTTRRK